MSKLLRYILYAGVLALVWYVAVLSMKPDHSKAPSEQGMPVDARGGQSLVDNRNAAGRLPPSTRERHAGTSQKRVPFQERVPFATKRGRGLVDNGDTEARGWSLVDNGGTEARGWSLVNNGDTEARGWSLVDNGDTE